MTREVLPRARAGITAQQVHGGGSSMQVWWHRAEECPRRAGGRGVGERPRKGRRRRAGPATAGTAGATSAGRGPVALMEERRGGGG